ncbi:MAG: energy-coupling factor transporter transmembrane protein EcfT [Anaerolineales bacterium]|nr:energy-coupling factor transporter transmembrane protein EcfT [Anaerolineales bacterium]
MDSELPTLFKPGRSWLHDRYPLTKLTFAGCLVVAGFAAPGLSAWLLLGALTLPLAASARLARPLLRALLWTLTPLTAALLIVHGLFNPANRTVLAAWGGIALGQEGLSYALTVLGRLANALGGSLLFLYTTHPGRLMTALQQRGLPPGLTYLIISTLQLLPLMRRRARQIWAAQQARGLRTQGGLPTRLRALLPMVAPLVLGALLDTEERALALEGRGFSMPGRRTSLLAEQDTAIDQQLRLAFLVGTALIVIVGWLR